MEFVSETHKAIISNEGLLKVVQLAPHQLRITRYSDKGVQVDIVDKNSNVDGATRSLLGAMSETPVFVAGWAGNSEWNVDLDCGFQRWRGVKPTKSLSKALTNCGFDTSTKKQIMSECRKHKVDYVPRYG
jgi:hypothetical protein